MTRSFPGVDPRRSLPATQESVDFSAPFSSSETEDVLLSLMDAFKPRVPTHKELLDSPHISYILCGQQQVIDVARGLLMTFRKDRENAISV